MKTLLFAAVAVAGLSLISAQDSTPPSPLPDQKALDGPGLERLLNATRRIDAALAALPATKAPSPNWEYLTVVWPVPALSLHANGQPEADKFYPLAAYGDWELVTAVSSTTAVPVNVNAGAGAGGLKVSAPVIVYTLRRAKP